MTSMRTLSLATLMLLWTSLAALAGDGLVALQTGAASCPSSTGIYTSCSNGTVTDNRTGLVWLANANCFGMQNWQTAMEIVAGLGDVDDQFCTNQSLSQTDCDCGLSDGSSPGEWRLPSASEWQDMIADAIGAPGVDCISMVPTITNDAGTACWVTGPSSFTGVQASTYWASSTAVLFPNFAWGAILGGLGPSFDGTVGSGPKTDPLFVWPVRGGQ